ncbi:BTAD domain-containing putative transcriptional regulator [Micromonospora sp. NPDC048170]|uniref:BTAD domain-containing putative transcriptional regulator n=1 Tax=Micromonospora sp. NPDC048170 TaxID=3154819 RepID=UPI003408353F
MAIAVGWALWALLATAMLTHLYARASRRLQRLARLRLPRPLQGLTAALLGATAVTVGAGGSAPAALAATATDSADSTIPPANGDSDARAAGSSAKPDDGDTSKRRTVTVRRGDTLSAIAARRLDDADRWREIYSLNRGARFATGSLTDPDLIRPGWTLRLPTRADAPAPPAPSTSPRPVPDTTPDNTPPSPDKDTSPSTAPATATPEAPASPDPDGSSADCDHPGVSLGDRGWIDAALAAAVLAAGTLAWAYRQHHHTSLRNASAESHGHDPQVPPLPAVLARIRRTLPGSTPTSTPAATSGDSDSTSGQAATRAIPVAATSGHLHADADPALTSIPSTGQYGLPADAGMVTAAQTSRITGVRSASGLGLTGPAAQAAARGFLVSALAADAIGQRDEHGQVVISSAVLATLLDDSAGLVVDTPGLIVTDSLTDALAAVEEQILHRTRMCCEYEVDTVAALRDAHPSAEALPPLLLIADATAPHERARTTALLTQGQRLDIHGVMLGAWPDGDTVDVDVDGTTTVADGKEQQGTHLPAAGRLTVLTPADTTGLLAALAEAHAGAHQPPARGRHAETREPRPRPAADGGPAVDAGLPPDDKATPPPSASHPATTDIHRLSSPSPTADDQPESGGGLVGVQVLGGARILDRDTSLPLRAKALELLVYLTVHDGEATQDAILDDLLPDAPAAKAPHRLHTYVSALRKTLARTGGRGTYLTHPARRYVLNRQAIDTDLWRMRAALRDAEGATSSVDRLAALRRAVDAYGGGLADGFDYEWIEAHREGIRRQARDAHLALATTTPDPDEALAVLEAAIRHDPYAEPLYQQAMRTHATLGHLDEVHALRQILTRRLAEIDATPSKATLALADHLAASPQPHRPTGRPRPRDNGRLA